MNNLTCYIHLQCDRGPSPSCLDWAEICDGILNSLDGRFDEEHCSQVEINNAVYEPPLQEEPTVNREKLNLPTLLIEDAKCREKPLTSSCISGRQERLFEAIFSVKDDHIPYNCSSAFKCVLVQYKDGSICNGSCRSYQECVPIINRECPSMFNIPNIPVLFGDIYLAYEKNDSIKFADEEFPDPYICYNNLLYDDYFTDSEILPELLPKLINEQNETDGTVCEYWACNNLHTRCNCFWNCENGEDEFHCDTSLILCENERIWLNNDESTFTCFCPHSYYGSRCEYQNQRVSLAIKFQAYSDSRQTLFEIIIQLIDGSNERITHSYVQFTSLFARDYQKIKQKRILYMLICFDLTIAIPPADFNSEHCSKYECIHGKCIKYHDTQQDKSFCQCYPQWSGQYCTIPHVLNCTCSSDSLCVGIDAHSRSICVCPLYKFGPRCFLKDTICELNGIKRCNNSDQCIPLDLNRRTSQLYTCICSKGPHSAGCEQEENKINLSFEENFHLLETILIHFIKIETTYMSKRTTIFKKISSMKGSIVISWSDPSNRILIEDLKQNIYFIDSQNAAYHKGNLTKQAKLSDRCPHINELFNKTIVDYHLLRCMKYDHEGQRLGDCFQVNHAMKYDCLGENECMNDGQCFLIGLKCYYIQPSISLINQANIIKTSIALNIILIIIVLFTLKFWILIFAQMSQISNRSFLNIQCLLLDYLLRIFIHMDQWLNACVACERAITVIKGTRFDKQKSIKVAKFIIILLLILNIFTFIHEPLYR
ncbi:unnamed protein product [Adineta steineri]|uniref:EGF-like domain-containing protein n=1 Tax=Adineta steineri TaxID=433720 RepID=A0A813VG55_9BILA|nr:unnamed protein product [Adineta steineri]